MQENEDMEDIHLTNRQKEVLKCVIGGDSNPVIARKLSISLSTVKAHVSAIIDKFHVESRIDVTREAMKRGFDI